MKKIKNEIEQCIRDLTSEGGKATARFVFPEEFVGFQGHFPAKKILPGVCQVQCALTTLEKANKRSVVLKEIVLAKYLAPVMPGEELTCVCSDLQEKNGEFLVKAVITKDSSRISEFKLRVAFAEGNKDR